MTGSRHRIQPAGEAGSQPLRVLLVAAGRGEAALIERMMAGRVEVTNAFSCPEALGWVDRSRFDICLFDAELGEASVLRFLRTLRAWGDRLPVVLLAMPDDEELTVRALQQGARDYLVRGALTSELLMRSFRYVTEQIKTERALRQASRRYRNLFERSVAGTFRLSLEGRLLDCNPTFLEILGYPSRDDALADDDLVLAPASAVGGGKSDWLLDLCVASDREIDLRRTDGGRVRVLIGAFLVEGEGGEPQAIEGTLVDLEGGGDEGEEPLADPVGARSALPVPDPESGPAGREASVDRRAGGGRASDRLANVSRLVGGVVHDLNNLMTTILGYANLLSAELSDEDVAQQRAEEVRRSALRARALVNELLAAGRRREGPQHLLEVPLALQSFRSSLEGRVGAGVRIAYELSDGTPAVRMDPFELERVLANLALNARDAMADGGRLTIRCEAVELDESRDAVAGALEPGRYARIAVRDEGIGMDRRTRERIFEPFFTTKSEGEGTGLGLVSVRDLVRQNHGALTLESAPGRGTTVEIWLPAADG